MLGAPEIKVLSLKHCTLGSPSSSRACTLIHLHLQHFLVGHTFVKFQVLNCPSLTLSLPLFTLPSILGNQVKVTRPERTPSLLPPHPNCFPPPLSAEPLVLLVQAAFRGILLLLLPRSSKPTCLLISASKTQSHVPAQHKCCPFSKLLPKPQ